MSTLGEVLGGMRYHTRPMPFQKPQLIRVTATWPVAKGLGNPKKEVGLFRGSFMEVIGKAQAKWPGASISVTTIDQKPEWAKVEQA